MSEKEIRLLRLEVERLNMELQAQRRFLVGRIEELEEALREVLEIVAGWCRPMTDVEKLASIQSTVEAALSPSEASEKEEGEDG